MNLTQDRWTQDVYLKTYKFAAEEHTRIGQKVPGTDISYIMHLSFVSMEIIAALNYHPECDGNLAIQCALLHDVIEDPGISYDKIAEEFGQKVADGIKALSKNEDLEKTERMIDSLNRIKKQPKEIWMVKLADRITNLQPPPSHWSKEKIETYLQEAKTIYKYLGEASDYLSSRLLKKIEDYSAYAQ